MKLKIVRFVVIPKSLQHIGEKENKIINLFLDLPKDWLGLDDIVNEAKVSPTTASRFCIKFYQEGFLRMKHKPGERAIEKVLYKCNFIPEWVYHAPQSKERAVYNKRDFASVYKKVK